MNYPDCRGVLRYLLGTTTTGGVLITEDVTGGTTTQVYWRSVLWGCRFLKVSVITDSI